MWQVNFCFASRHPIQVDNTVWAWKRLLRFAKACAKPIAASLCLTEK